MRIKDIQVGQPYFYQKGRASWRQRVNGDGAAFVLSTETFVRTSYRDRGMDEFVPKAEYDGYGSDGEGLLAVVVQTNVHQGDVPQAAREIAAAMTVGQVAVVDFTIPSHVKDALAEHSCFAYLEMLRPQVLLGEWDEIYGQRKHDARVKFEVESERAETRRSNADRWQDAATEIADLLDEGEVSLMSPSSHTGDMEGKTRVIDIDVLERIVRLAQQGQYHQTLTDTTGR